MRRFSVAPSVQLCAVRLGPASSKDIRQQPGAFPVMLRFLLLVVIAFRIHAEDGGPVTELDAPGWAPAVEEDLQLAATIDVSKPPKTCRPEVISKIDWGVATAAYQVEGAHNQAGKSPSIWDAFVKVPGKIRGDATGDVADDFFHKFKEDIALMKQLGVKMHRFSLAWTRILPQGKAGSPINPRGVTFYNNLINEMLAAGIEPVATIYHWDLPQVLQDEYGGFISEQIVTDYEAYAATVFKLFGDRIKNWITFNEPPMICEGYNAAKFAPGVAGGRKYYYGACHNVLKAHAAAVKTYRAWYQPTQQGKIGFTTNVVFGVPLTNAFEDKRAARNKMEREFGWLLDPLTKGDYPESLKQSIGSDLPAFTDQEKADLKGSIDFIGVNVYTARYVYANPSNPLGFKQTTKRNGKDIGFQTNEWLYAAPGALGGVLAYVGLNYDKLETWVTEFGTNMLDEQLLEPEAALHDEYRIQFYHAYLNNACQAIERYNLNVKKMFAWTFLDNFEWVEGYDVPYGLVHVDFKSGTLQRRLKDSAHWWSENFFRPAVTNAQ